MPAPGYKYSDEVWGIVDRITGSLTWTHGGSSTKPRMMVYASEAKAKASLRYAPMSSVVRRIYVSDDRKVMEDRIASRESLHWHDKGV